MSTSDIPRAFPHTPTQVANRRGMTLRDYFAAKALQGMLSRQLPVAGVDEKNYVEKAYVMAGHMMEQREKENK